MKQFDWLVQRHRNKSLYVILSVRWVDTSGSYTMTVNFEREEVSEKEIVAMTERSKKAIRLMVDETEGRRQ